MVCHAAVTSLQKQGDRAEQDVSYLIVLRIQGPLADVEGQESLLDVTSGDDSLSQRPNGRDGQHQHERSRHPIGPVPFEMSKARPDLFNGKRRVI